MSRYVFKMPDLGEGTVSAEVLKWYVAPGDVVAEDQVIAEVMTEKAAIELSAPVSGRVLVVNGEPGELVAVGSELIVFETEPEAADAAAAALAGGAASAPAAPATVQADGPARSPVEPAAVAAGGGGRAIAGGGRVMASPATRRRAKEAGIDLAAVAGSGPGGRITRADFEAAAGATGGSAAAAPAVAAAAPPADPGAVAPGRTPRSEVTEVRVIGLRRVIAQRMSAAKRDIPHFAYVEEVDVTELEALRVHLNSKASPGAPSLTYLPFVGLALARTLAEFPQCNALYDAGRNVLLRHAGVHLGVATQTPDGLKVPVVRHVEAQTLHGLADAIRAATERARTNRATREELAGSTITLTSLGKLGGIASTPVINAPEVAIVGLNRAVERPVVRHGAVAVRRMMNLSSSFDHRFVDGFDAAAMIQALKERLEHPATIFL